MTGLYVAECKFPSNFPDIVYALNTQIVDTLALRTCVVWNMNRKIITALALFYVSALAYASYNYLHMVATQECQLTRAPV